MFEIAIVPTSLDELSEQQRTKFTSLNLLRFVQRCGIVAAEEVVRRASILGDSAPPSREAIMRAMQDVLTSADQGLLARHATAAQIEVTSEPRPFPNERGA